MSHVFSPDSPTDASTPFELFSPEYFQDPYPILAWLRENRPVCPVLIPGTAVRAWAITRYGDAEHVLRDADLFKNSFEAASAEFRDVTLGFSATNPPGVGRLDPPEHTFARRRVATYFTARRVEGLAALVGQVTDEILDRTHGRTVDAVHEICWVLPTVVIFRLLGIRPPDLTEVIELLFAVMTLDASDDNMAAQFGLSEWVETALADSASLDPGALMSDLVSAPDISIAERGEILVDLLVAATNTIANLIGDGLLALIDHPAEQARLWREPHLLSSAIEEFIRYENPAFGSLWRFSRQDSTLGNVVVPAGEPILVIIGSANRDPARFSRPQELDLARNPNHHLGFGRGIHSCFGTALTRLEATTFFGRLIERYQGIELKADRQSLSFRRQLLDRGLDSLPLQFTNSE